MTKNKKILFLFFTICFSISISAKNLHHTDYFNNFITPVTLYGDSTLSNREPYPLFLNEYEIFNQLKDPLNNLIISGSYPLDCHTSCEMPQKTIIPLSDIFVGDNLQNSGAIKQVLLSFSISNTSEFDINLEQHTDITVDQGTVMIASPALKQEIIFELHKETTHLSFLLNFQHEQLVVNYMESIGNQQLYLSPSINLNLFTPKENNNLSDIVIFNSSPDGSLIMEKILIAQQHGNIRHKRGTAGLLACLDSPLLALYNVVVQGHCDQVESTWAKIKGLFFGNKQKKIDILAGKAEPLKPKITPPASVSAETKNTLTLIEINTHLYNQSLTLPATANYCNTPIDNVIGGRYPRQIKHSCANWLSSVLEDFTLLFGASLATWSSEYLIQTLNGILDRQLIDNDNDAIEAFSHNPEIGLRLIQTVGDVAEREGRSPTIDQITAAFSYAQNYYAHYVAVHSAAEASQASQASQASPSCSSESDSDSDSDSSIDSPLQAQAHPLGTYRLALANYVPQDISPLILQRDQWITTSERFEVEIIRGTHENTRQQRDELIQTIERWRDIYNEKKVYCNSRGNFPTQIDTTRYAGQSASRLIRNTLERFGADTRIAVVRFNHQIINISTLNVYSENVGGTNILKATNVATVTDPTYILTPDIEGTIRRSGTAAIHKLIQQLISEGVTSIRSEVISEPSAIVHQRLGFAFLSGEVPETPPIPPKPLKPHDEF